MSGLDHFGQHHMLVHQVTLLAQPIHTLQVNILDVGKYDILKNRRKFFYKSEALYIYIYIYILLLYIIHSETIYLVEEDNSI